MLALAVDDHDPALHGRVLPHHAPDRVFGCCLGAHSSPQVLHGLVARQEAHHDVPVSRGAAPAHLAVDVRPAARDRTIAHAARHLAARAVRGRPGGHGARAVQRDHGDRVVALGDAAGRESRGVVVLGPQRRGAVWSAGRGRVGRRVDAVVRLAAAGFPRRARRRGVGGREVLRHEPVADGEIRGEVPRDHGVRRVLQHRTRDADGVLDAAEGGDAAGFHRSAVHDHGVESRLSFPISCR